MSSSIITERMVFNADPAKESRFNTRVSDGSETITRVAGGWQLLLDATNEDELCVVDFNDDLFFDIDKLRKFTIRASVSAIPSGVNAYLGLAAAHNATVDSIATRALFQLEGASTVTVRTDDGVSDSGDIVTPFTVDGTPQDFVIDFASGVESTIPVYQSKTGKGAVKFYGERNGSGIRRLQKTGMDMSGYALGLQPYIRIDKASGAAVGSITIHHIEYELEV